MQVTYTAFDGKQFDNEVDCADYEHTKRSEYLCEHGHFFGDDGTEFTAEDLNPEYVCYAFFDNIKAVDEFNMLADMMCAPGIPENYHPDQPLNFKYVEDKLPYEGFCQYCDIIADLKEKIEDLIEEQEKFM